jgi:hypothetical protein
MSRFIHRQFRGTGLLTRVLVPRGSGDPHHFPIKLMRAPGFKSNAHER